MALSVADAALQSRGDIVNDSRKRKRLTMEGFDSSEKHIGFADARQTATISRTQLDAGRQPFVPSASARSRRLGSPNKPRYASAAAAAAAATGQVDGYKPREERSWEEFHPDFDIEAEVPVFGADEVDGPRPSSGDPQEYDDGFLTPLSIPAHGQSAQSLKETSPLTPRRRPGRPPRRGESMLNGLGSPPAPRIVPIPFHNPRERLNLPKPSYRKVETFAAYEADRANQINYVDKTMAHVGFQESEMYFRPESKLVRLMEGPVKDEDGELCISLEADKEQGVEVPAPSICRVEYDMDEQDEKWLEFHNLHRKEEQTDAIKPAIFEITMTQIEAQWHALEKRIPKPNPKPPQTHRPRSSSAAAVNGEPAAAGEEQDTKCAICDDGDCENTNAIVFCDGCDLAVHQECYGVPFIPEGQWLCRKCQVMSKSVPACLFCPNTEGAFKLTNEQRWAHLLCSIWIPEVTLGNPTFMEPIMDVAKVPKSRWKLTCYICNQKMGACIQCGHKACFLAFHVTCARRAKLYLKMKSTHGGVSLDASVLKAFCDKHVEDQYSQDHDVPRATLLAKEHYRRTMKGRRWADSQASALALLPSQDIQSIEGTEKLVNGDLHVHQAPSVNSQRKKTGQSQKNIWRLPSGAPIVPQVIFDIVVASLQRFAVRKRKEFVAEVCKYWSLKREARRGAALLKRLQLQLESFSSSEITRRNFAAMGAAGGPRLKRRIDLADDLLEQLRTVREACQYLKGREELKLQDVQVLRDIVDTIYYPLMPLLDIAIRKALSLDPKGVFTAGFIRVDRRIRNRFYSSVAMFSRDLGHVFRCVVGLEQIKDVGEAHRLLADVVPRDDSLTSEQKDVKRLAKRIVKAVQPALDDAFAKEAELVGGNLESEKASVNQLTGSPSHANDIRNDDTANSGYVNGVADDIGAGHRNAPFTAKTDDRVPDEAQSGKDVDITGNKMNGHDTSPSTAPFVNGLSNGKAHHLSAAPVLVEDDSKTQGGIPWYMEPFDPCGTEVHEERWTGRDVLRGMSEELSEMGEDELNELGPSSDTGKEEAEEAATKARQKLAAKRRRKRGRW